MTLFKQQWCAVGVNMYSYITTRRLHLVSKGPRRELLAVTVEAVDANFNFRRIVHRDVCCGVDRHSLRLPEQAAHAHTTHSHDAHTGRHSIHSHTHA
jgi:hypothetical protein